MTGRRLLDIAAIFKASRGVAAKHVALRQNQLDVYSKTSSLAKSIKTQTDRVALTVNAASYLTERFNGSGPDRPTQASQSRRPSQSTPTRGQDGVSGLNESSEKKNGLFQDYFYERSDRNARVEPPSDFSLAIKQEKAEKYPLSDGSILPADPAEVPKRDKESYSQLPQTETVRAPLADGRKETAEGQKPTSSGKTSILNSAVGGDFTTSGKNENLQQQAEKQIPSQAAEHPPEAHFGEPALETDRDRDVFYTPSLSDEQVISALPHIKSPANTIEAQEDDELVPDARTNRDVFYSSTSNSEKLAIPQAQAIPEQAQPIDEAYTELFHSPRVARMLGGQPRSGKPFKGLEMPGAQETPVKHSKSPQEKDQVSSSIRTSAQESQNRARSPPKEALDPRPSQAKRSKDVQNLATNIAKDAGALSADTSQISSVRDLSMT